MNFNFLNNKTDSGSNRLSEFEDPFILPSNHFIPTSLDSALDFSLMLYYINPRYRRASIRTISHFITDVDFSTASSKSRTGASKEEKDSHYDFMTQQQDIFGNLLIMGQEWAAYGNSFWRMSYPFHRELVDTRSGKLKTYALSIFPESCISYNFSDLTYTVPDPIASGPFHKRPKVSLKFIDRVDLSSEGRTKIKPVSIDPRRIFIQESHVSKETRYVYDFEEWFRNDVKAGVLYQVNHTPIEMLEAIAKDESFLFEADEIFHFKSPTIAGLRARGWGLPETLLSYRSLHQVQIYRKIDEQIGMDFMMPFRIFSPSLGGANITDALMNQHLGAWSSEVKNMITRRRKDPFAMHSFPFPIEYQEVGANGKQLVPKDLIEYQNDSMLDDQGYPAELFKASLQIQQVPTALRLFESSFNFLHRGFNRFCQWVSNKTLKFYGSTPIELSLQKPSMADDLEERHIYLQLAAGGEISRAKAYAPFGIKDPLAEVQERLEEDIEIEKTRAKIQSDFEREQMMGSVSDQINAQQQAAQESAMQQGGASAGGPPVVPAANPSATPLDLQAQGEQLAMQALQIESDGERRKFMQQVAASNPTLHSVMKQQMENQRSQAASQGRAQAGKQ